MKRKKEIKSKPWAHQPWEDKGRDINTEVKEKIVSHGYKATGDIVRTGYRTFTKGLDFGKPKKVKRSFNSEGLRL